MKMEEQELKQISLEEGSDIVEILKSTIELIQTSTEASQVMVENLQHQQEINKQFKLEQLKQAQLENNQLPEQQENIAQLEEQLKLAQQQEQELQSLKNEKARLETKIKLLLDNNVNEVIKTFKLILEGNINNAHNALTNALINTDEQIIANQKIVRSLTLLAIILIIFDILFVLTMPFLIMAGNLNDLLNKVGIGAILFFTFPALLILLIVLSLLRHQKQLIAEIRHYSMLKHKIELYGGILKAAQYTAASMMELQNSKAAKYIQETFNEIKTELLKSPNFDLNSQPHIVPEDSEIFKSMVELVKSSTEVLKTSTEASKAAAESVKKAVTPTEK